jgi:carotenoid cleavage dioxygenase-like enzyme
MSDATGPDMTHTAVRGPNPYLTGNFAPVRDELTVTVPLPVEGAIPPELEGMLLRNGPNPAVVDDPDTYHWFSGDGMVHAIELRHGAAVSYRNRWVRTRKLSAEVGTAPPPGPVEPIDGSANTHVIFHAGRILALIESGFPHRLGPELDTLCVEDFDAELASPMTAHPHADPETGALAFFGYDVFGPPFLRYHELDGRGTVVHTTEIEIPRATMQHDFGVTATRVVFLDLPVIFDMAQAEQGLPIPFTWAPQCGARVGVLDRGAPGSAVTWIGIDPCYVFHVMNAFDDGAEVVLDVCRYPSSFDTGPGSLIGSTAPALQRWRVDPVRRTVNITDLDDLAVEFPRVDDAVAGRPYRFGYCTELAGPGPGDDFSGLVRYDLTRGESVRRVLGEGISPGEPVFVRSADGHADDEGWVLTVAYDASRDASDLYVLDASSMTAKPEAVIHLPQRVPFGFHGSWVPAARYR